MISEAASVMHSLSGKPETQATLRQAATELEANFLAEMLKAAGMGETKGSFNGGAGEDGFSSFLVREQARLMAESGGIGLAEQIFQSLARAASTEE